jgi:hypothetical protein
MDEKKDKIADFLGMASIEDVIANKNEIILGRTETDVVPYQQQTADPRKDEDFEMSRDTIKNILEQGQDAINELMVIAKQSQSPTVYEKLGALINSMTSASKTLMEIHAKKKAIDKVDIEMPSLSEENKTVNNNTIVVGSTAELQKIISDMKKANND